MKNIPEFLKMSWTEANKLSLEELRKNYFNVDCKSASSIKSLLFLQKHFKDHEPITDTGEDDESLSLVLGSLIHEALETSLPAFEAKYAYVDKSLLEGLEAMERLLVEAESPFLAYMDKYNNKDTKALKETVLMKNDAFADFKFKSQETYNIIPSKIIANYSKVCDIIEAAYKKGNPYLSQLNDLNKSGKVILDWEYPKVGKKGEDIFALVKQGYESAILSYGELINFLRDNYGGTLVREDRELPILWKHEGVELKSMLDRVKAYDNFTLIIDYKTGIDTECVTNYLKYMQYYQFSMYREAYVEKFPERKGIPILFVQVFINPYKGIAHNAFISSDDMSLAKSGGVLKPYGDMYSHVNGIRKLNALSTGEDYPFIDKTNPFSSHVIRGWSEVLKEANEV